MWHPCFKVNTTYSEVCNKIQWTQPSWTWWGNTSRLANVTFLFVLPSTVSVKTSPSLPRLPSGLPSLSAGSHSEAGAVLRGAGGAGRHKPRLRLRPLHPETRPAARRGPQGQWPHRRMPGENACPSLCLCNCQVPLSFLREKETKILLRSGQWKWLISLLPPNKSNKCIGVYFPHKH